MRIKPIQCFQGYGDPIQGNLGMFKRALDESMNLTSILLPLGLRLINSSENLVLSVMPNTPLAPIASAQDLTFRKGVVGQSKTDLASLSLKDGNRKGQILGIQWSKQLLIWSIKLYTFTIQCIGYKQNTVSVIFLEKCCFAIGNFETAQILEARITTNLNAWLYGERN